MELLCGFLIAAVFGVIGGYILLTSESSRSIAIGNILTEYRDQLIEDEEAAERIKALARDVDVDQENGDWKIEDALFRIIEEALKISPDEEPEHSGSDNPDINKESYIEGVKYGSSLIGEERKQG